eukprot:g40964.t1
MRSCSSSLRWASLEHCSKPEMEMLAREQGGEVLLHLEGMFGSLDTEEGGGKWAGVAGEGAVGLWGGVGGEGTVDQGVLEGTVPEEGRQGRRGEYVSGDGISLEVVDMAPDDLLDVDAGGMV